MPLRSWTNLIKTWTRGTVYLYLREEEEKMSRYAWTTGSRAPGQETLTLLVYPSRKENGTIHLMIELFVGLLLCKHRSNFGISFG